MGYFNLEEMDDYGAVSAEFFFLKDDKDVANVRFMYETINDARPMAVHKISLGGKDRYVNCLRSSSDPLDACPLCETYSRTKQFPQLAKIFIPMYVIDEDCVKIWERGKDWMKKLSNYFAEHTPLVATPFEIERNGAAGDSNTKYEAYAMETDNIGLQDLPELPEVLGIIVLEKNYEELIEYLETGNFARTEGETQSSRPVGRNVQRDARAPQRAQKDQAPNSQVVSRRRPAARAGKDGNF